MAELALGYQPAAVTVHLTDGADFVQSLATADGTDFPAGTVVTLAFGDGTEWAATVTGPTVAWNVDKAQVAVLHEANPRTLRARVIYTDGTGADLVWMSGAVRWHA